LLKEIRAGYFENSTKKTAWGSVVLFILKAGGTYINHCALNG
jgi:hypothetical protein